MADIKESGIKEFITKAEGGFVNDPDDAGGATNKGITLQTFRRYYGEKKTVEDLKRLTDAQWFHIFKLGYWDAWKADQIKNNSVARILVDFAFNSGTGASVRCIQKNVLKRHNSAINADGVVGPVTLATINKEDPRRLFQEIKEARLQFIKDLIARRPTYKKFERGLKNRVNAQYFTN